MSIYTTRIACDDKEQRVFEVLTVAENKQQASIKADQAMEKWQGESQLPKDCLVLFTEEVGPEDLIEITDAAVPKREAK